MEEKDEPDTPPPVRTSDSSADESRGEPKKGGTVVRSRRKIERKTYGSLSRDQFYGTLSLSAIFLVIVMTASFSLVGTAAGTALGTGFGGFVASFGTVEAHEGTIFPVIDEHPACENAPQLMATIEGETTVSGYMRFYKDLPLPAANFTGAEIARLSIVSNMSEGEEALVYELDLFMSALTADLIELGGPSDNVIIREFGPETYEGTGGGGEADRFSQNRSLNLSNADYEFGIGAESGGAGDDVFYIEQGKAIAHTVAFAQLDLPSPNMYVTMGNESEFTSTPHDPRVVTPSNRSCSALVDATN